MKCEEFRLVAENGNKARESLIFLCRILDFHIHWFEDKNSYWNSFPLLGLYVQIVQFLLLCATNFH